MVGMLAPEFEEVVTGEAEVREIFSVPRVGKIAGCYVHQRHDHPRLEGPLPPRGHDHLEGRDHARCKRFKDDVREVQAGFECGIGLSDFQDLKQGDIIETFEEREIPRA